MRIAVDIGYGYVKAIAENGNRLHFPSVVAAAATPGALGGVLGGQPVDYQVTINGQNYLIGDAAIMAAGTRTWEQDASQNQNLVPLLATALAILGNGEPVDLAVGLPMAVFRTQKDTLKTKLSWLNLNAELNSKTIPINVKSVFIFPQGAGSYYSAILDPTGNTRDAELAQSSVAVIDVGYKTTDYLVMARGPRGLAPNDTLTGGIDAGMNHAIQAVQKAVTAKYGSVELNHIERSLAWEDGKLHIDGQTIDLKLYLAEAQKALADSIMAQLKLKWGGELRTLAAVVLAGGGGTDLITYFTLASFHKNLKLAGMFSNAEGYLIAQHLAQRKQQQAG